MLPVQLRTGDPVQAWQAGLAWAFIIGVIVLMRGARRPVDPAVDAAGGDAGLARRASRSRSSPCARRRRCGRRRGSALVAFAFILRRLARLPADAVRARRSACCRSASRTAIGWIAVLAGWSNILEPSAVSRVVRAARAPPADPRRRGAARAARHRPAAGDRDPAGRLQLRRGHEQRRVGGRRGRPLQRPPDARRRRHRRDRRLVPRLARSRPPCTSATPAGSGRRPDRVLAGDRDRRRRGLLHRAGRHLPGGLPHAGAGARCCSTSAS